MINWVHSIQCVRPRGLSGFILSCPHIRIVIVNNESLKDAGSRSWSDRNTATNPDCDPQRYQNLIDCSLGHAPPLQKFNRNPLKILHLNPNLVPGSGILDPDTYPDRRQNLIGWSQGRPHRSTKFHQNLFISFWGILYTHSEWASRV